MLLSAVRIAGIVLAMLEWQTKPLVREKISSPAQNRKCQDKSRKSKNPSQHAPCPGENPNANTDGHNNIVTIGQV